MQDEISRIFNEFNKKHIILEILPNHAKVLSIDRNISIRTGMAALYEQKTSQCVVWDSLRSEFKGTLMLRDFLEVSLKTKIKNGDFKNSASTTFSFNAIAEDTKEDNPDSPERNMYSDIAEEMENKSVYHIFEMIDRVKHKIVKISHESSLKQIWDIMIEGGLKMVALESVPDPENKIPGFIQGFLTYTDFLEFFVDNFDGDVSPFNLPLRELDFYYAMKMTNKKNDDNIKVIQKDELLFSVLKKMLDYRIGMIPIVEDLESKKTIGLFYLKDVFWLLRSGKYFNKPVHMLLKAIYQLPENQSLNSDDEEGEESDDDDQTFDDFDVEDGAQFLEQLDEESKQSSHHINNNKQNRCKSFGYEEDDYNLSNENFANLSAEKEGSSSQNHIFTAQSKEKLVKGLHKISSEEATINKNKSSESNKNEINENLFKHGSIELGLERNNTNDPRGLQNFRRKRATSSVNSYSPEFYSKKLVGKTKEILGINRIAIFNRD